MSIPLITINLVVLNGEKYIRHCLDGILNQTYPKELLEFNILDNGSLDNTASIIENAKFKNQNVKFLKWDLIKSKQNLGMWPGQEELLKYSSGKYVLAMAVDVILDRDFIKNAVEVMEKDPRIGALEAKIYKYELSDLRFTIYDLPKDILDTCGFEIFKSRRVANIGHGQKDGPEYNKEKEIFGVEGAAPFFRRGAMEDIRVDGEFCDHDFFWYGDDLDFAWRMNLFGWKQIFAPSVVAWHDRQTTKSLKKNWLDYILRVPVRRQIPIRKRQLDWRNLRWTIIKNDYTINILRDLPIILGREISVFGYAALFEPKVLLEFPNFLRLLPKMIGKRNEIMKKATVKPEDIRRWFN